jgi:hypothetical protein
METYLGWGMWWDLEQFEMEIKRDMLLW